MAAMVQSFSPSSTITMLQSRPASASDTRPGHHFASNPLQMNRNSYHGINSNAVPTTYRGQTPTTPYSFPNAAASLSGSIPRTQPPFMNKEQRASSSPITSTLKSIANENRYPAPASVSTVSSSSSDGLSSTIKAAGTRDDSSISSTPSSELGVIRGQRPQSQIITSVMDLTPAASKPSQTIVKPQPERYRRAGNRRTGSNGGNAPSPSPSIPPSPSKDVMAAASPFVSPPASNDFQMPNFNADFEVPAPQFYSQGVASRSSAENISTTRPSPLREDSAARYRPRSLHTTELSRFSGSTGALGVQQGSQQGSTPTLIDQQAQHPLRSYPVASSQTFSSAGLDTSAENINPSTTHRRQSSSVSSASITPANLPPKPVTARQPSFKQDQSPALPSSSSVPFESHRPSDNSVRKISNPDAARRVASPSPLSKPVTMGPNAPATKGSFASAVSAAIKTPNSQVLSPTPTATRSDSAALRTLTAVGQKEEKKSKSHRLRRALSFGSAAELRKASAGVSPPVANANANEAGLSAEERTRIRKERYQDEREAEQARIAARQEAGGIGAGIYSGQGNFFSGSTDNLSISSTASSASVMLRKMGKGVKKSTRSLVSIFRPKSVIGVPAADGPLQDFSHAQVSMVTVEAERERVNVNANPHDQIGGGTGFPKLERNSIDAGSATGVRNDAVSPNESPRRSIVGGDVARAEVLAAVKKGILKRAQTDSPTSSPRIRALDGKTANFGLPDLPNMTNSPNASPLNTPGEEQGHRRSGSVAVNGEDYFMSALRFRGESKSSPVTPMGISKRNATFSPRIQFHDTWPSGEYDRRGEIATCNRLTPMLAQQIKEELNNFKMEMEVHENSKIYTHFF